MEPKKPSKSVEEIEQRTFEHLLSLISAEITPEGKDRVVAHMIANLFLNQAVLENAFDEMFAAPAVGDSVPDSGAGYGD